LAARLLAALSFALMWTLTCAFAARRSLAFTSRSGVFALMEVA
jgi:hypothetical protein